MGISHSRITLESVTSPPLESRPGSPPIWTKIGIYDEYTCTPTPRFLKIKIESTFGGGLLIVDGISGQSLFSAKNAALFSRKYELFDVSGKKIYKLDGVRHTMLKSPDPVGEGTLPKSLGQIVDESTFDIFSRGRIEIVNRLSGANEVVVLRVRKDETIEVRGVSGQLLAKFGQRFLIRGQEIEFSRGLGFVVAPNVDLSLISCLAIMIYVRIRDRRNSSNGSSGGMAGGTASF